MDRKPQGMNWKAFVTEMMKEFQEDTIPYEVKRKVNSEIARHYRKVEKASEGFGRWMDSGISEEAPNPVSGLSWRKLGEIILNGANAAKLEGLKQSNRLRQHMRNCTKALDFIGRGKRYRLKKKGIKPRIELVGDMDGVVRDEDGGHLIKSEREDEN